MVLILVFLSIIGHTAFCVELINQTHATARMTHHLQKKIRNLLLLQILAWPTFLCAFPTTQLPGILAASSLSQQPGLLQLLIISSAPLTLISVHRAWRWQRWGWQRFHAADSIIPIALPDSRTTPALRGAPGLLGRFFPWNEIWSPSLSLKTMTLTGFAAATVSPDRPLRILHISDLHFDGTPGPEYYRTVIAACLQHEFDMVALTGDLSDEHAQIPHLIEVLRPLQERAPCLFILGNHDWRNEPQAIRRSMQNAGWTDVGGRLQQISTPAGPLLIAGSEFPWMPQHPPDLPADDTQSLRLLLAHTPDDLPFARRQGFHVMLAGHTHGGHVVLPVHGPVFSPSRYGVRFASGLFRLDGLWMHVSRGAGGKHSLRWRCPPEVTLLTIQSHAETMHAETTHARRE